MELIEEILVKVQEGRLSPSEAVAFIKGTREKDLSFARVDLERPARCGSPEVIYCPGKTRDQIVSIMEAMQEASQDIIASRADAGIYEAVRNRFPEAVYHAEARMIILRNTAPLPPAGSIVIACAGTSDIPVAEEAAVTAEHLGGRVTRMHDVGVAGLHRLTSRLDTLRAANVAVVVAGMEGALPSVIGGLVSCPVIAVPTSVGYGTGAGGYAALLAMLNSCAAGITVVNIDNGFGAGIAATQINRLAEREPSSSKARDE